MDFRPYTLTAVERVCTDIAILKFDRDLDVKAGEFVYTWIPEIGEKPFSALTDKPFSLVVIDVGEFTSPCPGGGHHDLCEGPPRQPG